ncbi:hypothetical protein ACSR0Z_22110 [Streptomyces viridosporus]
MAKQTGASPASVTRICATEGIDFDRSATEAAVKARVIDMKASRTGLAANLLDDMTIARQRMHSAEDNRQFLDGARALAALAGTHVRLVAVDKDDTSGVDAAKSMLGKLATAIGVAVADDDEPADEDGEAP